MSSESSSSESDSDVSDVEECAKSVARVFQSMKKSLTSPCPSKSNASTRIPTSLSGSPQATASTSKSLRSRSVYKTFDRKGKKESKGIANKEEAEDQAGHEPWNCGVTDFFIDKGASESLEPNIVSYDLTNINDNESDNVVEDAEGDDYNLTDTCNDSLTNSAAVFSDTVSDEDSDDGDHAEEADSKEADKKKKISVLSSKLQSGLAMNDIYLNVNPLGKSKSGRQLQNKTVKNTEPDIMKKSVISDDFERQDSIATTHVSVRQLKKQRKLEREKTKGSKWYNMPATELTEERKYDLAVLQMRKVLDPKRFYKANDLKAAPKYFQFGRVVEDATDFYSSRIPKKQRKSTIVEELLADAEFRKFNKRKYSEIQEAKRLGKGPYKHMKRLKKRKK